MKTEIEEAVDELVGSYFKVHGADDCVWLDDLREPPRSTHLTRDQAQEVGTALVDVSTRQEVEQAVDKMIEQDEPRPDQLDLGPPEATPEQRLNTRRLASRFAEWIGDAWPGGEEELIRALRDITWAISMDPGLDADFTAVVQRTRREIRDEFEAEEQGD